ncbi:MAG: fibronectin type III domain-containing protein, partial [Caldilineae bacterium]
ANRSIGGDAPDGGDAGGGGLYFTRVKTDHVSKITGVNLIIADNVAQAGQGSNRWGGGGGLFAQDSQVDLSHVTMSNNQVLNTMQGPAIVSQHNLGSSDLKLRYSIVANHEGRDIFNNPRAPIVVQKAGDVATISDTLFHNNTVDFDTKQEASHQPGLAASSITITGKLSGDPMFLNPGAPDYDYHIGLDSAALDKAGSSTTGEDIDGETRPFGPARDVGADEAAALHLYVHSVKSESLVLTWVLNDKLLPTIDGFEVEIVDESTGQSSKQQVDAAKRSLVVEDLKNGITYRFTVRAMDAAGKALAASETRTGTPQAHHVFLPTAMK